MKQLRIFLVLVLIFISFLFAKRYDLKDVLKQNVKGRYLINDEISINKIPGNVNEFLELRSSIAKSPLGGYALFIISMITYSKDKDLGLKFFTISIDKSQVYKTANGYYKGYKIKRNAMYFINHINKYPFVGNIYIDGTDYKNDYKLKKTGPYIIKFNQITIKKLDTVSIYAFTTSGNLPRPITLIQNNKGYWKASNFSSVVIGPSKIAKKKIDDDL